MADPIITISSHTSDNHAKLCVSSDVEMVHLWESYSHRKCTKATMLYVDRSDGHTRQRISKFFKVKCPLPPWHSVSTGPSLFTATGNFGILDKDKPTEGFLQLTFMSVGHQNPRHELFLAVISELVPDHDFFISQTTLQAERILPVKANCGVEKMYFI